MSGGKMSPRQKMINMMYLVLIALLALNVSKEIIKAFNLIENSLENSTKNMIEKNKVARGAIQAEKDNISAKAALAFSNRAMAIADEFQKKIELVKNDLLANAEGRKPTEDGGALVKGGLNELTMGDNMEVHSNYFLLEKGTQRRDGKAYEFTPASGKMRGESIRELINSTREQLIKILDDAIRDPNLGGKDDEGATKRILEAKKKEVTEKSSLRAEDGTSQDGAHAEWVTMYLEHSPLAGVFALLSKYCNDARSLEAEITQTMANVVHASDFKFNQLVAVISSPSSAILQGSNYEADIYLAAYDDHAAMNITVDGAPVELKDGVGKYKRTGQSVGESKFKVSIAVPGAAGKTKTVDAEGSFSVFAPMAAISADELNVIYEGLDNPMTITVAGVDPKNVSVSVAAAANDVSLAPTGVGGHYRALVPVRKGNDCIVNVSAKVGDRVVQMGSKKFKIRRVPRPVFMVGPIDFSGLIQLSSLKIQSVAAAVLENFVYDGVKYTIQGYKFTALSRKVGLKELNVNGASIEPIKGILSQLGASDFIQFSEIRAMGPGGMKYLQNAGGTLK